MLVESRRLIPPVLTTCPWQDLELAVSLNLFSSRMGERGGAATACLAAAAEALLELSTAVQQTLDTGSSLQALLQRIPAANMDIAVLPVQYSARDCVGMALCACQCLSRAA